MESHIRKIFFRKNNDGKEHEFSFDLCRSKSQQFGAVVLDQWWMPIPGLYGQRRSEGELLSHNHVQILRLFWVVLTAEQLIERKAAERYLLASLVSSVRAQGSRSIFDDSIIGRTALRPTEMKTLDSFIKADESNGITPEQFAQGTMDAVGLKGISEALDPKDLTRIKESLTEELLGEACDALQARDADKAHQLVTQQWSRITNTIGRRAGNPSLKIAMNAISYEARTTFHDCYSVAWSVLISLLEDEGTLDATGSCFHRFWHCVQQDSDGYLFHGHVFGLHPATCHFLKTPTGQVLMGAWLANGRSKDTFAHLLNGLLKAVHYYAHQRAEQSLDRSHGKELSVEDPEKVQEINEERRRGRRRK